MLRRLLAAATAGARLHVSVPNARHYSLVRDLCCAGRSATRTGATATTRTCAGSRAATSSHAIEAAGWAVQGTSHPALHRSALLDRLSGGRTTEFLVGQWYVLATKPPA